MLRRKRTTARGIVIHGNKVLLLERWRRDTKAGEMLHYFSIPGGGILAGETAEVAVVRELFEEASLVVRPQRLVAKQPFADGTSNMYFACEYLSGEPSLHPSAHEVQTVNNRSLPRWITKKELEGLALNKVYEPIRKLIAAAFNKKLPDAPQTIK